MGSWFARASTEVVYTSSNLVKAYEKWTLCASCCCVDSSVYAYVFQNGSKVHVLLPRDESRETYHLAFYLELTEPFRVAECYISGCERAELGMLVKTSKNANWYCGIYKLHFNDDAARELKFIIS